MDVNKILHIATEAGRIILENGGETYRVEETIFRICTAFNVKDCDSFVTPTGIMVSITDNFGQTISLVKRVRGRTVDLEKISKVNDLSRNIKSKGLTSDEIKEALMEINNEKRYGLNTTAFFSATAAAFFTLLFGGDINDFFVSFLIGIIIKLSSSFFSKYKINEFFINTFGGAITAIIALLSIYTGIGHNLDEIIIGSIMLLVPGLAITNALRDTIAGDLLAALARALEAFLIAVGIATGTGVVMKFWFTYIGGF
ncbi:threonine/serine exporter family protein [Clostridium hydrogeniformans]|uniref:threonine/serine exporter family protein n=1 Tax=Clostridium hydrogeniformans TaxID=349933 RepID=UPI00047F26DE|nr:threonine/serine exporter family protein [Clostridium hydrogeniformans]